MLTVLKLRTTSGWPWRLAWNGLPIQDVYVPRKRDAAALLQQLLPWADWTQHPDTWDAATRAAVAAVLAMVPSVQEAERLRRARRPPR